MSTRARPIVPDSRRLLSRLIIVAAAYPLFMGWIFLVAGIGIIYLALGLAMILAGCVLDRSPKTAAMGVASFLVGCSPIFIIVGWFALGFGD
jgi:hypothetical protein